MDFKELQHNWNEFGKRDPLWAILTTPPAERFRWDVGEFFQTGRTQIAQVMDEVGQLMPTLSRERCLDFGCGVGRLTQALCAYFQECHGVDVAPSMIALANKHNRYRNTCTYHLNESDDLRRFDDNSFNFIYSFIVLQHMRPEYSTSYIKEFLRVLKPGGLVIFQLTSEPIAVPVENYRLPDSAFQARIMIDQPFSRIEPNEQRRLSVRVQNCSDIVWPHDLPFCAKLRVGNHWLDAAGTTIINDDGRFSLPRDLAPHEEISMSLIVTGPKEPGQYILEIDMVQEGVSWFKDRGCATVRLPVKTSYRLATNVVRALSRRARAPEAPMPVMEVYGVPRQEVVSLIEQQGGRILRIADDQSCGEEWQSFMYSVTK